MTKRTPREAWEALEEQASQDEMDRILALSDEELAKEIAADGAANAFGGETAEETVEKLFEWRERQMWRAGAKAKQAAEQAQFDEHVASRPREPLTRDELLARIRTAQHDPRFDAPATVMFRNRKVEAASDEELLAILEELEGLLARKK